MLTIEEKQFQSRLISTLTELVKQLERLNDNLSNKRND